MIVDVVHPVPVTYVRKGGRVSRSGLARVATPVGIEPVPDASVRFVASLASPARGVVVHEHGGTLWRLLDVPEGRGPRTPVTPAQWFEFLGGHGDPDGLLQRHVLGEVAMSPLAALCREPDAARETVRPRGDRGEPFDFHEQRALFVDGRAWAANKVRDHLAGRTLVTDTRVLLAWDPVAHVSRSQGTPRLVGERHRMHVGDVLCTPGRAEEVVRAALGGRAARKVRDPADAYRSDLDALGGFADGDGDLRTLANWLPEEASRHLSARAMAPASNRVRRECDRIARELRTWLVPASLGTLAGDDMRQVMELVRDAGILLAGGPGCRSAARGVDPVAEPGRAWEPAWEAVACLMEAGLERFAPAPEDEDAMAGLGMRP